MGALALEQTPVAGSTAVLTLVGAIALLATPAHVEAGLVGVFAFWVACYAFTAYQEDHPEWEGAKRKRRARK